MARPHDISPALWQAAELIMDELRNVTDDRELIARAIMADRASNAQAEGMTPVQSRALAFIQAFIAEHGYSPSYREIAAGLTTSAGSAHSVIRRMIERGLIAGGSKGRERSISLAPSGATP